MQNIKNLYSQFPHTVILDYMIIPVIFRQETQAAKPARTQFANVIQLLVIELLIIAVPCAAWIQFTT